MEEASGLWPTRSQQHATDADADAGAVPATKDEADEDDSQQHPHCDASEERSRGSSLTGSCGPLMLSRSASAGADQRSGGSVSYSTLPHGSSFSQSTGSSGSSELVHQLQRLCSRQRLRSEERQFVRDVERVLALLRQHQAHASNGLGNRSRASSSHSAILGGSSSNSASGVPGIIQDGHDADIPVHDVETRPHSSSVSSNSSTASSQYQYYQQTGSLAIAEIELLFDCIADLFDHRNYDVRAIAFETVTLCMNHYGHLLSSDLRHKIFRQLEDHPAGDFTLRQKALRVLTQDGRNLDPFNVELGWFLLRLLDESDEQRDLLGLIQNIFRRSPLALDFETVIAITNIVCGRCDLAWTRGEIESCKRYLNFFHVLATHNLEHAASTSVSLRTLCCMVNADGHGTWSIMKHLLNGTAGFQVLRGLIYLLENPYLSTQWVLRGAVFFVGMSCWGSQRVGKFEDVKWAPILLAMESVLKCNNGVVIFEVILALQRLIKKFGAAKSDLEAKSSARDSERKIFVEWDIILRMFKELRPWLSLTDDGDSDEGEVSNMPSMMTQHPHHSTSGIHSASASEQQFSVSIHQTRIPRELLDTLSFVEELVAQKKFAGEVEDFFDVLEDYLPHLNEGSTLFLLRHRADTSHPAHHGDWLQTLRDTMRTFFSNGAMFGAIRLEALEALHVNLHVSRNVCEDRVIEEVMLPTLGHVYNDHHAEVRRRGLDYVTEVARLAESVKFDALLNVLADAVTLSLYEDSQVFAASGIISLFSSYFNHMPPTRSLRMYEIITKMVETHRNWEVRKIALSCLLHVCQADSDFRLQWKDNQVRTSRFLFCCRDAVRNPQTGACVPVALGLRAMVTLVSTETHADLFRMAVSGIRQMLENRIILADVDISDMTLKIISSIDYRAFGRAAVPDELARIVEEMKGSAESPREDTSSGWEVLSRRNTDTDVLRYMNNPQRRHGEGGVFKSNLRDTVAMLCKTKFMTMGLELLTLIISYASELNGNARHHLIKCLVDTLDMQLNVADKDVVGIGAAAPSGTLHRARSAAAGFGPGSSYEGLSGEGKPIASSAQSLAYMRPTTEQHDPDGYHSISKPASPHFGFTSRVFSRFQSTGSQGNLFHAFSSSAKPLSARSGDADLEDHGYIQQSLQSLYGAEFAMLHISTNMLSLLALRMPEEVTAQIERILQSARLCFTTLDGDFRADGFGATLEMVGNIVYCLPTLASQQYIAVVETLLIGFEYAQSKQLSCMAFRLLCHVIFKCAPRDRIPLASVALPRLQQLLVRTNSLLIEAAIDFLMSFAYSKSFTPPPALCTASVQNETKETDVLQSRSWVYKNSLLTIQVSKQGSAKLVIRRANCTNHWDLQISREYLLDPGAALPKLASAGKQAAEHRSDGVGANEKPTPSLGENDPNAGNLLAPSLEDTITVTQKRAGNPVSVDSEELSASSQGMPDEEKCEHLPTALASSLTPESDIKHDAPVPGAPIAKETHHPSTGVSQDTPVEKLMKASRGNSRKQVTFALSGNSPAAFPHPSASLPPLPAYDGIGGSPSYFCEAHPGNTRISLKSLMVCPLLSADVSFAALSPSRCILVRRRAGLYASNAGRDSKRNGSIKENGDGALSDSDGRSPHYEDDGPDGFSLDGSSSQPVDSGGKSSDIDRPRRSGDETGGAPTSETPTDGLPFDRRMEASVTSQDPRTTTGTLDPLYLMMQLFDLTVENRPHLLMDGAALSLGLSVLDRTPEYETHKIGLVYVRNPKQRVEVDILGNTGGSVRYLQFLRGLGSFTKLQGLPGYTGGLDTANNSDGKFGLIYKDNYTQVRTMTLIHATAMSVC